MKTEGTIEMSKIIIGSNIRKDLGDFDELVQSVKSHGVRQPIRLTKKFHLVDGSRRIKAAIAAGLKEIRYTIDEEGDIKVDQMIAGIFGKNLNPVEEGLAFKDYMAANKLTLESFAAKINKSVVYVERRIKIAALPKEIQANLIDGKIQLGHALLLAKLEESYAKKVMGRIIKEKLSVDGAIRMFEYGGGVFGLLKDARFGKEECGSCRFNGSQQSELFQTGTILNGRCMNPSCYNKKTINLIAELKNKFKSVLFKGDNDWDTPKGFVSTRDTYSANRPSPAYVKKCRDDFSPETYLVKIDNDTGEIEEYVKRQARKGDKTNPETSSAISRQNNQMTNIAVIIRDQMIECASGKFKPGSNIMKALLVIHFLKNHEMEDSIRETFDPKEEHEILNEPEQSLDNLICAVSKDILLEISDHDGPGQLMLRMIFAAGYSIPEDFRLTKDILAELNKSQLLEIAGEFNVDLTGAKRNPDIIDLIIAGWKPGMIPKLITNLLKEATKMETIEPEPKQVNEVIGEAAKKKRGRPSKADKANEGINPQPAAKNIE